MYPTIRPRETGAIEGGYYQTENEYSIYVYYRPIARSTMSDRVTTVRMQCGFFNNR